MIETRGLKNVVIFIQKMFLLFLKFIKASYISLNKFPNRWSFLFFNLKDDKPISLIFLFKWRSSSLLWSSCKTFLYNISNGRRWFWKGIFQGFYLQDANLNWTLRYIWFTSTVPRVRRQIFYALCLTFKLALSSSNVVTSNSYKIN